MWPMSDVPVMTWWLLSIVLALGRTPWHAAAAAPRRRWRFSHAPTSSSLPRPSSCSSRCGRSTWRAAVARAVLCALLMVPGALAVAAINQHLLRVGRGLRVRPLADDLRVRNFWPNLARYPRWLIETQTPFVLLALIAPPLLTRDRIAERARMARCGLAFACMVLLGVHLVHPV